MKSRGRKPRRRRPIRLTRNVQLEQLEDRRLLTLASPTTIAAGDFDSDGYDDLVIGKPTETVGYRTSAGLVEVIYGKSTGLSTTDREIWHQDTPGIKGVAEKGDNFGWALAVGDFDDDGYDDLAIGAPFESLSNKAAAGVVHVIYGSSGGLTSEYDDLWQQGSNSVIGNLEADDKFGYSLAAGDFDNDNYDDLAIGAPEEDVTSGGKTVVDAGQINVLYGGSGGLSGSGDQIWWQGLNGLWGSRERNDRFGQVLTVGNFNGGGGYDDLAVGVPGESINNKEDAGVVQVIYGSSSGLSGSNDERWHQDDSSIIGSAETGDQYGGALAAGDFDNDGKDDLAIGAHNEDVTTGGKTVKDAGLVSVLYGTSSGLSGTGDQVWWQGRNGVAGKLEKYDRFGRRLAAGDFDNDGKDDLAIGAPQENWGSTVDSGATHVLYGSSSGLTGSGDQIWHQGASGIWSSNEKSDWYGSALVAGNFDGDSYDDLAIEVQGEGLATAKRHGVVNAIYGRSTGLNSSGDEARWTPLYKIDVVFKDSNLSTSQQRTVLRAASRWSQIITGNLPAFTVSGKGVADDLVVEVWTKSIDGSSGVLARAGSKLLRSGTKLPATAEMTIDSADRSRSDLYDIIVHEFGHTLGFVGWVINRMGLTNSSRTRFTGANATREYKNLFGYNVSSVPLERNEGHWRESVFDNELMTPSIDSNNRLSRVTVAALKDMGYRVNYSRADSYSRPGGSFKESRVMTPSADSRGFGEAMFAPPPAANFAEVVSPRTRLASVDLHASELARGLTTQPNDRVRVGATDRPAVVDEFAAAARSDELSLAAGAESASAAIDRLAPWSSELVDAAATELVDELSLMEWELAMDRG